MPTGHAYGQYGRSLMNSRLSRIRCYFCECTAAAAEVMILHFDIAICGECVDICSRLIRDFQWQQRYEQLKEFGP